MTRLANNALRTKNLDALLKDMGIGNAIVNCNDELVVLKPANPVEAENLTGEVQRLFQTETTKPAIQRYTLNELLSAEITAAKCDDQQMVAKNKRSLQALLPILELDFALDEQQEYLDIELPEHYVPIFGSLTYKYMTLKDETLRFDLKKFLKDHREELVLIGDKAPVLLCDAAQFEKKKVFYAQKRLSADEVEVTPHVFIPPAAKPPHYHFVLDTSSSMEGARLAKMKESVLSLADALFKFQPDATIDITEFNSTAKKVGSYTKDSRSLSRDVNQLKAVGATCLFGTTLEQLSTLAGSNQHNNILLFTDGENSIGDNEVLEAQLKERAQKLKDGSPLIPVRNKFFIISYGAKQPKALHEVTEVFGSPVINTDSSDFIAALSDSNNMEKWAAARDLFTCRLEVATSNSTSKTNTYACSYDLSGQFTALAPIRCKDSDELHLTLVDGDGAVVLDDKKPAIKPVVSVVPVVELPTQTPVLPGSTKVAANIGVFSGGIQLDAKPPVQTTGQTLEEVVVPTFI